MANNVIPESDTDSDDDIPSEMRQKASKIFQNLLPGKSKEKYLSVYHEFQGWMDKNNIKSCDESILTMYFNYLKEEKKLMSSTLWSRWSMLKSTLSAYDDIDVGTFKKLKAYLKKLNKGYKPKKSKILYSEDLAKFCTEADDEIHLTNKVILIVGVFGACRRGELHNITFDQVEDSGKELFISIPETKTDVARSFIITNDLYGICKKYMALRPTTSKTAPNFFINYQKGKCTCQPIGINKIGSVPAIVAEYLNLSDPKLYTGHSLRRSGATLLADSGADITSIMRFGGWKSQAVAASYIEDSKGNKRKIFKNMLNELSIHIGSTTNRPSTSKNFVQSLPQNVAPVPPHNDQNVQPPYGEFDGIYTNNGTCGELPEQVLTNDDVYDVSNDTHLDPEPKSNNIKQQSNEKKRNQRVTKPVSYKRKLLTDNIINSMNRNNCNVTFKVIRNTVQDCVANNITQEDSDED